MIFRKSDIPADLQCYFLRAEIGLEDTPDAFVAQMVEVFREVRRVLRDDGTLWLNLGDSYSSGGRGSYDDKSANKGTNDTPRPPRKRGSQLAAGFHEPARQAGSVGRAWVPPPVGFKPKDLLGIPWMVAFALRADGWYLRQDIIWSKPNPMPESVRDRCTKAHEYVFLLSKGPRYYFDAEAIAEAVAPATVARLAQDVESQIGSNRVPGKTNGAMKAVRSSGNKERKPGSARGCPVGSGSNVCGSVPWEGDTRNKRSVWTVATQPFKEAHFATYPPELIEPCILAGCPEGGTVLDPFGGAGTTGMVADRLQRNAVLIELNPAYAEIARRRLEGDAGMFSTVEAA